MKKLPQRKLTGDPKSSADAHMSERRPVPPQARESVVLPPVRKMDDGRFITEAHLPLNSVTVVLTPLQAEKWRVLHVNTAHGNGVRISNINQITQLIDALYAVGAAWQKEAQTQEVSRAGK